MVDDYRHMLIQQFYGQAINKAEHNRRPREQLNGRSKSSVEFKYANLSAVLAQMGFPTYVKGYLPRGKFQALLQEGLEARIFEGGEFLLYKLSNYPTLGPSATASRGEFG